MSNEMKDWLFDNEQEQKLLHKTVKRHTINMNKINWKRLLWAIKEEALIVLGVIFIVALLAIPWVCIALTKSYWWFLLYPIGFFIGSVWERYNGR